SHVLRLGDALTRFFFLRLRGGPYHVRLRISGPQRSEAPPCECSSPSELMSVAVQSRLSRNPNSKTTSTEGAPCSISRARFSSSKAVCSTPRRHGATTSNRQDPGVMGMEQVPARADPFAGTASTDDKTTPLASVLEPGEQVIWIGRPQVELAVSSRLRFRRVLQLASIPVTLVLL